MDPQQELFVKLLIELRKEGYRVFDGPIAPEDAKYPFICVGESQQLDDQNKTAVFGAVYQTLHVWHNDMHKRGDLSNILLAIKHICRRLEHTKNFDWTVQGVDQRILTDTTTKEPLLHGVLDVTFKFN